MKYLRFLRKELRRNEVRRRLSILKWVESCEEDWAVGVGGGGGGGSERPTSMSSSLWSIDKVRAFILLCLLPFSLPARPSLGIGLNQDRRRGDGFWLWLNEALLALAVGGSGGGGGGGGIGGVPGARGGSDPEDTDDEPSLALNELPLLKSGLDW